MQDGAFEWDDAKASRNRTTHRVSFEMARDVFSDMFAVEWVDIGQPATELRYVILGMVEERLLFVSYTQRGDRIRIISARLAVPFERRKYHNENES